MKNDNKLRQEKKEQATHGSKAIASLFTHLKLK